MPIRKGVSLISRIIGHKKKDTVDEPMEQESELGEERPEGADAQVFGESFENLGYSPHHPQPPKYIKVRSHNKKEKEFNRVFLAQELRHERPKSPQNNEPSSSPRRAKTTQSSDGNAIWALQFSKDGRYLATAGQDKLVRVWAVMSSREDRRSHEKGEESSEDPNTQHFRLSAPVFRNAPARIYEGHTGPVLDLSWSKVRYFFLKS